jgi:WD40 repeat protein
MYYPRQRRLFSYRHRAVGRTVADHGGQEALAVAFSPDGSMLATGDSNGNTYVWTIKTGKSLILRNPGGPANAVQGVAFSPDGSTIATGDSNGSTYLWNARTGSLARTLQGPASGGYGVQALAFSPDGRTLAIGDVNGFTYIWQA